MGVGVDMAWRLLIWVGFNLRDHETYVVTKSGLFRMIGKVDKEFSWSGFKIHEWAVVRMPRDKEHVV
jgi:hypothetical protein